MLLKLQIDRLQLLSTCQSIYVPVCYSIYNKYRLVPHRFTAKKIFKYSRIFELWHVLCYVNAVDINMEWNWNCSKSNPQLHANVPSKNKLKSIAICVYRLTRYSRLRGTDAYKFQCTIFTFWSSSKNASSSTHLCPSLIHTVQYYKVGETSRNCIRHSHWLLDRTRVVFCNFKILSNIHFTTPISIPRQSIKHWLY